MEGQSTAAQNEKYMLFISRIPHSTTPFQLKNYLKKFGKIRIESFMGKTDFEAPKIAKISTKSRKSFKKILRKKRHYLKRGARILVEEMLFGEELKTKRLKDANKKVTIFGLYGDITEEDVSKIASEEFGEVDFCYMKDYSKKTKKNGQKYITFVSFVDPTSAVKAVEKGSLLIKGISAKIKSSKILLKIEQLKTPQKPIAWTPWIGTVT